MPWHLGGEPHFTDKEFEAYLKHYREQQKREDAEAKKVRRQAPKRGRR
jgi:hypothetical protein